jgi:hypothetical protein
MISVSSQASFVHMPAMHRADQAKDAATSMSWRGDIAAATQPLPEAVSKAVTAWEAACARNLTDLSASSRMNAANEQHEEWSFVSERDARKKIPRAGSKSILGPENAQ